MSSLQEFTGIKFEIVNTHITEVNQNLNFQPFGFAEI